MGMKNGKVVWVIHWSEWLIVWKNICIVCSLPHDPVCQHTLFAGITTSSPKVPSTQLRGDPSTPRICTLRAAHATAAISAYTVSAGLVLKQDYPSKVKVAFVHAGGPNQAPNQKAPNPTPAAMPTVMILKSKKGLMDISRQKSWKKTHSNALVVIFISNLMLPKRSIRQHRMRRWGEARGSVEDRRYSFSGCGGYCARCSG